MAQQQESERQSSHSPDTAASGPAELGRRPLPREEGLSGCLTPGTALKGSDSDFQMKTKQKPTTTGPEKMAHRASTMQV